MAVTKLGTGSAKRWKAIVGTLLFLLAAIALYWGYSRKNAAAPEPIGGTAPVPAQDSIATDRRPEDTAAKSDSASIAPLDSTQFAFRSRPPATAYPRHLYSYRPVFSLPGPVRLRLVKGPDSMRVEKGVLLWSPAAVGNVSVVLEAARKGAGVPDSLRARQSFSLRVVPALVLALKPLPAQVKKGDTVTFDLRGSAFPEWAASTIGLRIDFDGDGRWDTAGALANLLVLRHAYARAGRFSPKVEARADGGVQEASGDLKVVGAVNAVLSLAPDTVEPGGAVYVDASGSRGDGTLLYRLDLDGDGKTDWSDSASGKATLKAPPSGSYMAKLSVVNALGQEGTAQAGLRVNARPLIDVKVRNPKDHMAAAIEVRARSRDSDDSIRSVRINFTGDSAGWEAPKTAPDSAKGAHEWFTKFTHVYGRAGHFEPVACATAADGRVACRKFAVDIFNAPPIVPAAAVLHATLGKPLEIIGEGVDPDGKIARWEWDLDGDGKYDLSSQTDGRVKYTFSREGEFSLTLKVTTADGMMATGVRKVEVRKKWKS